MRRFEYIHGNSAKFWEIARNGERITTTSGKIGESGQTRVKDYPDYMAAEVDFDRLIREKLKRKFSEVEVASAGLPPIAERSIECHVIDDDEVFVMEPSAFRYLVWRMVEVGIMERLAPPPDLSRWAWRATRRLRLTEQPKVDAPEYEAFIDEFLDVSRADRSAGIRSSSVIPGYKFLEATNWIIRGDEAAKIADQIPKVTVKRHSASARQRDWTTEWVAFNQRASANGGYEVVAQD